MMALISSRPVRAVIVTPAEMSVPQLVMNCLAPLITHWPSRCSARVLVGPAERSLVLLHGFTNCPQQFDALGKTFFERGWNVFIPRYPRHGYTDRLNTSIAELRADHLKAVANRAVDAGAGMGERLTVAGLSLGAILTGLVAQTRAEIDRAVLIAPMLGLKPLPGPAMTAMSMAAKRLPNFYMWWDNRLKDGIGPPYGYPRFSTHAYAALFECGRELVRTARKTKS